MKSGVSEDIEKRGRPKKYTDEELNSWFDQSLKQLITGKKWNQLLSRKWKNDKHFNSATFRFSGWYGFLRAIGVSQPDCYKIMQATRESTGKAIIKSNKRGNTTEMTRQFTRSNRVKSSKSHGRRHRNF